MSRAAWAFLLLLLLIVGCGRPNDSGATAEASKGMASADMQARGRLQEAAPVERSIVREGAMTVRVRELAAAERAVRAIVRRENGFVESLTGGEPSGPGATVQIALRVPVARFEPIFAQLLALGAPLSRSVTAQDVTDRIVDADARLKVLRVEEESYLTMLRGARQVRDALAVRDRLGRTRESIETIEAGRLELSRRSALSKIDVTFVPNANLPPPGVKDPDWLRATASDALSLLSALGRLFVTLAIYTAILAPVWLGGLAIVLFLRKRAARPKSGPPPYDEPRG